MRKNNNLKDQLIRLGSVHPELRSDLRPILASLDKQAAPKNVPDVRLDGLRSLWLEALVDGVEGAIKREFRSIRTRKTDSTSGGWEAFLLELESPEFNGYIRFQCWEADVEVMALDNDDVKEPLNTGTNARNTLSQATSQVTQQIVKWLHSA